MRGASDLCGWLLAGAAVLAGGCPRSERPADSTPPAVVSAKPELHGPRSDAGPITFIDESFETMYPLFCVYRTLSQGERSGLWARKYRDKWVRWTGKLMAHTRDGLAIKLRPQTVTFDVSLFLDDGQAEVARRYRRGDVITFVGRLDSYDDVFQKLYLRNGAIVSAGPADAADGS